MNKGSDQTQLSSTLSSIADPVRRSIIERLSTGEATVGELAEPLEITWPAVTRHLQILESAGLIVRRREGRHHILTLTTERLREVVGWIESQEATWRDSKE